MYAGVAHSYFSKPTLRFSVSPSFFKSVPRFSFLSNPKDTSSHISLDSLYVKNMLLLLLLKNSNKKVMKDVTGN